jgi:ribosomal protein S18 acetylase RimI-like enzyme
MPSDLLATACSTDDIRIVPTATEEHVAGLNGCLDAVARERRYLMLLEGPSLEESRASVRSVLDGGGVHLVAVDGAGTVVGWCDVKRGTADGSPHAGRLGIGMLPEVRGRGLGRRLMKAAIEAARRQGMRRVDLAVFAANTRAIALYESLGFVREGIEPRVRKLDGRYDDDVLMALQLDELQEPAEG